MPVGSRIYVRLPQCRASASSRVLFMAKANLFSLRSDERYHWPLSRIFAGLPLGFGDDEETKCGGIEQRHRDIRWWLAGSYRANEDEGRNDGGTVTGGPVVRRHPRNPRPLSQQIPPTPVQWRLARPQRPPLPPPRPLPSLSSQAATGQRTSSTSRRPQNSSKSPAPRPFYRPPLCPPGRPAMYIAMRSAGLLRNGSMPARHR